MTERLCNFIDGKFIAPKGGKYIENFNPATGKVHSLLPDSQKEDVDAAVEAARKAFPLWASKTARERANLLYKVADLLDKNLEKFAEAG